MYQKMKQKDNLHEDKDGISKDFDLTMKKSLNNSKSDRRKYDEK